MKGVKILPQDAELKSILQELKISLPKSFGGGSKQKAKAGFKVYGLIEETLQNLKKDREND